MLQQAPRICTLLSRGHNRLGHRCEGVRTEGMRAEGWRPPPGTAACQGLHQ